MKASDRGMKHACAECACKYYDLGRKDARCPKCGGPPVLSTLPRGGRPAKASRRTAQG